MSEWTTLLDPALGHRYNYDKEVHEVCFLPLSENILGQCVGLLIPECELQYVITAGGEPVAMINRPKKNKNVRLWIRAACEHATTADCSIMFGCDTREQADMAAKVAAKHLPNHRRMPLERMYEAKTRTFKGLD